MKKDNDKTQGKALERSSAWWGGVVAVCAAAPILLAVAVSGDDTPASVYWQVSCVAVTVASKLPLPQIIPSFKRSLQAVVLSGRSSVLT